VNGNRRQKSSGLLNLIQGDFFPLFWSAYTSSFTKASILSAFQVTGIWLQDTQEVLKHFQKSTLLPQPRPSDLSLPHWNRVESLVRAAVANHNKKLIQEVESLIHCASTHTKLLEYQNQGLEASLTIKKKRKKSSKALLLQEACEKSGGGYFFSPSSLKSARALQAEYQH
jgi:hypothetical protein